MLILVVLVVEEDRVEFTHIEEYTLVDATLILFVTLELARKLVIPKHIERSLFSKAGDKLAFTL